MMNNSTLDGIVPVHRRGRKANVEIAANCYSEEAASRLYEFLKVSLADVDNWSEFQPGISFYPKLTNKNGQMVRRVAKKGDLIKILLPRWQSVGRLYDWREIVNLEERSTEISEYFFITIVPAKSPEQDVPEEFHFLRPDATVTFFVIRNKNRVWLEVHTRNEGLNFQLTGFKARLQSALMGVFMASGFYDAQWSKLMKSILRYGMLQMKINN